MQQPKPITLSRSLARSLALSLALALTLVLTLGSPAARAADNGSGLFVNLSSLDTGLAGHSLVFAGKALKRGHPVVVFLNHKAVLLAADGVPQASYQGKSLNMHLADLMAAGGKVIVCQMCMAAHGMTEAHLVDGAMRGNPELVQGYLFDPVYKVISW
ncbi:MAG: DsrE family protein [Hyphomicrobiales bacterium]|nr:DsrE family protein [Hyphomicrobiales bacterium]